MRLTKASNVVKASYHLREYALGKMREAGCRKQPKLVSLSRDKNLMSRKKGGVRVARSIVKISLILPIFLLGVASPAEGHTSVISTDPTYKSTLSEMPPKISIEFTENLLVLGDAAVNTISVSRPDGRKLHAGQVEVSKNKVSISIPQSNYQDGTYVVSYRVVSADGHSVSGSYEIYLNKPSSVSKTQLKEIEHHGFFHIHKNHLIEAGIILILIILWWAYRRFAKEQDE